MIKSKKNNNLHFSHLSPLPSLLLLLFLSSQTFAQIGGRNSFEFLKLPTSAKQFALGGVNASLNQNDVNTFFQNPALIADTLSKQASFTYSPFYADINYTTLAYAHKFKKIGTLAFGLQYMAYGKMDETDASGAVLGEFNAGDLALTVGKSFKSGNFTFGANLKFINSSIASYSSSALAIDLGGTFQHPKQDFTLGLVIKNLGFTFSNYVDDNSVNMPFDVQLGASYKPEFMPFRFSLTLHQLYQFDIVYLDPALSTSLNSSGLGEETQSKTFFDKVFRHVVFGGELLLAKGFTMNLGYNHLINRELRLDDISSFAGFSFGFGLKVKAFEFEFGRGIYHVAGGRSFLTLRSQLDKVGKGKRQKRIKN